MPAAFIKGHHLSIAAFCSDASASGVSPSAGGISSASSTMRCLKTGSAIA